MKKIIFIIFALLLLTSASAALAQTTLIVPIPGAPGQIANPGQYIRAIYQFSLGFGGLAAMGIIVFAAIKRIVSAGNVAQVSDANDMIKQAVIGLVLLFSAFLILYTINPNLVSLKLATLESISLTKVAGENVLDKINALSALVNQSNQATGKATALQVAAEQVHTEAVQSGDPLKIAKANLQKAEADVTTGEALWQLNKNLADLALARYQAFDTLKDPAGTRDDFQKAYQDASKLQTDQRQRLKIAKKALTDAQLELTRVQGNAIKPLHELTPYDLTF